jgi:hypothetical protein
MENPIDAWAIDIILTTDDFIRYTKKRIAK